MQIETLFDPETFTLTYIVFDPQTRDAVVIDPVLDYDPLSSSTSMRSLEAVTAFVDRHALRVHYVLETHAHADHLSGGQHLKQRYGAKIGIGTKIRAVQALFREVFDLPASFAVDGSQFDRLLEDGELVIAGSLRFEVIATPGHTPACVTYKIDDAIFTGDALFIEDYGTGRCDFPAGSADDLYTSVHERLYKLPDATRVFVGHDYQPDDRPLRSETTLGAEKQHNVQLRLGTGREEFVAMRTARDATLSAPRLLYPSVQVNVDAGLLPRPRTGGRRYLTIPLNPTQPTHDDGTPAGHREVSPAQLHAALGSVRLIDVREPAEFAGELGHIEGAELVPLATVTDAANHWDKHAPLALLCRSGRRSEQAAEALTRRGFSQVMNLTGGMLAWSAAGLPSEGGH